MSKTKNATLIGAVAVLLIIGLGFGAGYFFRAKSLAPQNDGQSLLKPDLRTASTSEKRAVSSERIYEYSPPSVGVVLHKKEIDVPKGTLFPIIRLSNQQPSPFQKGQKIVFYDDQGALMDMIGEVGDLLPAKEKDFSNVLIAIRTLNPDLTSKFSKAFLAMDTQMNVARLPHSAIVKGDGIGDYVWELSNVENGRGVAFIKGITVKERTNDFAVVETNALSSNDFITNPDDKLKDGQIVAVERRFYEAPPLAESDRIGFKIDAAFLKLQQEAQKALAEKQKLNNPGASSCGPAETPNAAQDFINKIRALSPPKN